ncbi:MULTISPECIES: hypothetical protein [Pseudomonas]|uniref:hypothetical protein n=1 Tax=Pseudomonas TaxID=286 RepID=UPI0004D821E7|nr:MULTISPECIES: hypothetical protein [Pseudomonas]AMO74122.1 hypothetical protein PcP3B5_06150 [Pseudomonas citronellolis]KES23912.1 hypothetical protein FG99_12190 [Pseudomonas sp. AAC]MBH3435118.1 hypothetical protein [Pseudomonas citronellolis]OHR78917.1 hypothetical protein HMPREF3289_29925 [Pseudomonas sp. HMSC75E02]
MHLLTRFSLCLAGGLLLSVMALPLLMFVGHFELIAWLAASGKPLAWLALHLPPADFWDGLTGARDAANNPHVRSFLELCAGFAQLGLLLALPLYYWGARR